MEEQKKKTASGIGKAIGVGIIGAAAGAGAVLLSQKKNRDKIKKAFVTLKKEGEKKLSQAEKKISDIKGKAGDVKEAAIGKSN